MTDKSWLDWGREIHAIAQAGLTFSEGPFDLERYKALQKIATAMLARGTGHSTVEIQNIFDAEKGYSTPKLDVRAAVFKGDQILLVKERETGQWTLPGGYIDVNESLSQAAARETLEESGVVAKPYKIGAIIDHRKHDYRPHLHHFYKIYMLCDFIGGLSSATLETDGAQFFDREQIPELCLDTARVLPKHIMRMYEHREHPELSTDFD